MHRHAVGPGGPSSYMALAASIITAHHSLVLTHLKDWNNNNTHAALALVCSQKVNVVLDNIFASMLTDRLVTKGTILEVLTIVFQVS